jgi:hypothetical protein
VVAVTDDHDGDREDAARVGRTGAGQPGIVHARRRTRLDVVRVRI